MERHGRDLFMRVAASRVRKRARDGGDQAGVCSFATCISTMTKRASRTGVMEMISTNIKLHDLDVMVTLHTASDPLADEWARYLVDLAELAKTGPGDMSNIRNFIVTDGGAPNAGQRALLADALGGLSIKVAVVTNSLSNPLKRGLATAMTWLNPAFMAFSLEKWRGALQHLDLDGQIGAILTELERLQRSLRPVASLTLLLLLSGSRVSAS
jgi:hypothetical protein